MRGKQAPKRKLNPDPIYNSTMVTKLINYVMIDGKKAVAQNIVYKAIEEIAKKTKTEGIEGLEKALENAKPKLEIRSRRVGGANFQVPVPVSGDRQDALAFKWIIQAARDSRKNL